MSHAKNLNVAVRETGDSVVFLHRLEAGGTDRSYGVHVGQLAGLPATVVSRATEVLKRLEGEHRLVPGPVVPTDEGQFALFGEARRRRAGKVENSVESPPKVDTVRAELSELDVNTLTPLEALNRLADLKRRATE